MTGLILLLLIAAAVIYVVFFLIFKVIWMIIKKQGNKWPLIWAGVCTLLFFKIIQIILKSRKNTAYTAVIPSKNKITNIVIYCSFDKFFTVYLFMRKNNIIFRSFLPQDAAALAYTLRAEDRRELAASHSGRAAAELLEDFIHSSRLGFFLSHGKEPAALFGVSSPCWLGRRACVWLVTGRGILKMRVSFMHLARRITADFLSVYPELYNFTDERYVSAVRFIRRLGGQFDGSSVMYGNVRFLYFTFRRNRWEE